MKKLARGVMAVAMCAALLPMGNVMAASAEETIINPSNVFFDYADEIKTEEAALKIIPDAADIEISVADQNGASGVVVVPAKAEENAGQYYLNAMVAGNELTFSAAEGSAIAKAESSISGELTVADGAATFVPAVLSVNSPEDEIITITMEDGEEYAIHTLPEAFPVMEMTGDGASEDNAGVYTFFPGNWMVRVNSDKDIIYYRDANGVCDGYKENFAPHDTEDGRFYSVFFELHPDFYQSNGGFASGIAF